MEVIIALITATGLAIPAYLVLRSTRQKDEDTKQLAAESGHAAHMSVVVGGLESVIKALQEDNKIGRGEIGKLRAVNEALRKAKGRIAEIENGSDS